MSNTPGSGDNNLFSEGGFKCISIDATEEGRIRVTIVEISPGEPPIETYAEYDTLEQAQLAAVLEVYEEN